jgi:AcrR family transcriptional regulator
LREAERLFADHGYRGVSLRTIATAADAHLALIRYHFGSKLDLYRSVWMDRYTPAASARLRPLARIDFSLPRAQVVREIMDVMLIPTRMMNEPAGKHFLRLVARAMVDRDDPEYGIMKELGDPSAEFLLGALRRALPELSEADLGWGFQSMTGVFANFVADIDRTTRLSKGAARSGDFDSGYVPVREYMVGGWLALVDRSSKGTDTE